MATKEAKSPESCKPNNVYEDDHMLLLLDNVPSLDALFTLNKRIGHGTFSSVYLGRMKNNTTINGRKHFAIKHIIPTSHPSRVYMELKCMKLIGGEDNVMGVTMCFREMNHIVLVMPHFIHNAFNEYVGALSAKELADYMYNLLLALKRVHSFGIIHRDVKPANFLYTRKEKRYSLIDFGLAQEVKKIEARNGFGKMLSPPIIDTPLATGRANAKRKLTVGSQSSPELNNKRPRQVSPPSVTVKKVLSTTTNSSNTVSNIHAIRRSPRKKETLSHKKENLDSSFDKANLITPPGANIYKTPCRNADSGVQESPSKHIRKIDAVRKMDMSDSPCGVRRSPRKGIRGPLEGLAKYLEEATSSQVRTPINGLTIASISRTKMTPYTSNFGSGSSCQMSAGLITPATTSARVSGINTPTQSYLPRALQKTPSIIQEVKTSKGSVLRPVSCHCYGLGRVCNICVGRSHQVAPRAGTPGFRAPEVLMRHPYQGTAVDMWSTGVMLLCLLSGRYPFFRAADDLSTLAEICALLGTKKLKQVAAKLEKLFTCSEERTPLDLMKVCEVLRNNKLSSEEKISQLNGTKTICSGCRQPQICVCLSSQNSSYTNGIKNSSTPKETKPPPKETKPPPKETKPQPQVILDYLAKLSNKSVNTVTADTHSSPKMLEGTGKSSGECLNTPKETTEVQAQRSGSSSSSKSISPGRRSVGNVSPSSYPATVYHLLTRLLDPNPETRISAEEALSHPFISAHVNYQDKLEA